MDDEEHKKVIALLRWQGVPIKYKRTMFGNYTPDTVVEIVSDALACYRSAMKGDTDA